MSSEDDKLWDTVANQLRKKKGYGPLTDEEAESAFDAVKDEPPLSPEEATKIVEQLIKKEEPKPQPRAELADPRAANENAPLSAKQMRPEYGWVFRNPGELNEDAAAKERRNIQDMLDEDDDDKADE